MQPHSHVSRVSTGGWSLSGIGSWGVRLTASGSIQLAWSCSYCDYQSSPVPHYLAEDAGIGDIRSLPTIASNAS